MSNKNSTGYIKHKGRLNQIFIYLGKNFRMFIYLNDWRVLPMSAIIAALVAVVAGTNMFKTMEGCMTGSLALACICIWNGFFNSIQVVCRERDIVKREHRSGLHISSYIIAHMIYQAFLCVLQTEVTILVCTVAGMEFPTAGIVTQYFYADIAITIFMLTYAADVMSLMISCIAKTTTAAMTLMPFMLIFELLFSGSMFSLSASMDWLTNFSLAKWGINSLSALAQYNSLPMVTVWNQLVGFKDFEYFGEKPIYELVYYIQNHGMVNDFCLEVGKNSQNMKYATTATNIVTCWIVLLGFTILFAVIAVLFLEKIDKDKR